MRDIYFSHEGISLIVTSNKVIKPVGNAMENWKIWAEPGKSMGYGEYFKWKDSDELISDMLKPTNITLDQLKQNPGGIYCTERRFRKYLRDGFNTRCGSTQRN